uniref:Tyrosine-protein phosphatase domain-containing protein n=1 Tax=Elaeophora elaphi TaxID=1147741 RepID=A0A0R3S009_9BILA
MVNYLERARALAESSPLPSPNVSPTQQRKPGKFSKVNFTANPQRDNTIGYNRVEDAIDENNYCMKHKVRYINASAQYHCCCSLMHAVVGISF